MNHATFFNDIDYALQVNKLMAIFHLDSVFVKIQP